MFNLLNPHTEVKPTSSPHDGSGPSLTVSALVTLDSELFLYQSLVTYAGVNTSQTLLAKDAKEVTRKFRKPPVVFQTSLNSLIPV